MTTRLATLLAVLFMAVAAIEQSDQHPRPIKVGITVMSANGSRAANGTLQRDRLIRLFRPDKKKRQNPSDVQIIAVPLEASSPEELDSEAREKSCDYVLYTTLVEASRQGGPQQPPMLGGVVVGPEPLIASPDTRQSGQQEFLHAIVQFKLIGSGEQTTSLTGSSSIFVGGGDAISAVTATLNDIAKRVKARLQSPAPMPRPRAIRRIR